MGVYWAGKPEPRTQPRDSFPPQRDPRSSSSDRTLGFKKRGEGSWGSTVLQEAVS